MAGCAPIVLFLLFSDMESLVGDFMQALRRVHAFMRAHPSTHSDAALMPTTADWISIAFIYVLYVSSWWIFVRGLIAMFTTYRRGKQD